MDPPRNTIKTESPAKIEKPRHSLIANHLTQMGTALGQKIPPDRITLYCRALSDIGDKPMKYAFDEALKHLGDFLPSIEQLRAYAEHWRPVDPIAETRRMLERADKPPDDDPPGETRKEFAERLIAEMRAKIQAGAYAMSKPGRQPGEEG